MKKDPETVPTFTAAIFLKREKKASPCIHHQHFTEEPQKAQSVEKSVAPLVHGLTPILEKVNW